MQDLVPIAQAEFRKVLQNALEISEPTVFNVIRSVACKSDVVNKIGRHAPILQSFLECYVQSQASSNNSNDNDSDAKTSDNDSNSNDNGNNNGNNSGNSDQNSLIISVSHSTIWFNIKNLQAMEYYFDLESSKFFHLKKNSIIEFVVDEAKQQEIQLEWNRNREFLSVTKYSFKATQITSCINQWAMIKEKLARNSSKQNEHTNEHTNENNDDIHIKDE